MIVSLNAILGLALAIGGLSLRSSPTRPETPFRHFI
jgi:hypothetical protein